MTTLNRELSTHSLQQLATNSRSNLIPKQNPAGTSDNTTSDYAEDSLANRERRQSTILPHHDISFSYVKIVFVIVLFILSLFSFVAQTESTAYLYGDLGFDEPFLLLAMTHGMWWLLWPMQFCSIALIKAIKKYLKYKKGYEDPNGKKWKGFRRAFASSVKAQHKNIYHSAELTIKLNVLDFQTEFGPHSFKTYRQFFQSRAVKYMFKSCFLLSIVLNIAGSTWYVAMGLSSGSDVTAIYNSSAFTAYLFAIPILGEKFSWLKMSSVVTAIFGVVVVAYSGKSDASDDFPNRTLGNFIILIGAILYGLYEVLYKKMACPPSSEVSARRQATFSNFSMCLIGIGSFFTLCTPMLLAHVLHIHRFKIPTQGVQWFYMLISTFSNLIFSVSFLALMALTSPVLSSVASLVTILIVGVTESMLWGVQISFKQMVGYIFVMAGFGLLTYASWAEITEEDKDDELIDTDTESVISFASVNGLHA
ncbi:hypothetical protein CANARDRAFT_174008 [[Candida] arabinofermentans NRRL YB-2248]|uniref:Uncharacterized protein n=1 Tax=[Candida] arabinofermentans NRRL YB-2248 TaxID=983967 RepID=A0A1E4T8U1_9ASCO|nr:hypothetical protein CANARDRAFT_174008 [[Candida] arabinofermentans NRRL YB-2248]